MIYEHKSELRGSVCLPVLHEILSLPPDEPKVRLVLAYLKVWGIEPQTQKELITVFHALQDACKDYFNLTPVLTFVKEKDIFNG